MSQELIIAGFHRSGTSLTAQLLHGAGLFVGERLLDANPSNPYGHFEDADVVRIHQDILEAAGHTWRLADPYIPHLLPDHWRQLEDLIDQRRSEHELWGFKDPRVCLFMGVWKHLMPDAKVLIVFRSFGDSTYSLERRHASQMLRGQGPAEAHMEFFTRPDLALRMWVGHNRALLAFADQYPEDVLAVSAQSLRKGDPLVDRLRSRWSLDLKPTPTLSVFDPGAMQSRPGRQPVFETGLVDEAAEVMEKLVELEGASQEVLT